MTAGHAPRTILDAALRDPQATEAETLRRHAAVRPDHTAIIFEERRTSYAALNRQANQVANGLVALEPTPQRQIAMLAKNSDDFFAALYGAAKAQHIAMPLNWRLSARELAEIMLDSSAQVLIIGAEFVPVLPELKKFGMEFAHVLVLDGDGGAYTTWREAQPWHDPQKPVRPEDIFLQLYTSGTTGKPKGVQISHRASMQMRNVEVSTLGGWSYWGSDDIVIVAMPNFHVGGSSWAVQWFARGATCLVQAQVDARAMLDGIDRHQVGHFFAVPTVLDMMLADPSCARRDFSCLRLIHYGGASITPTLLVRCIETFGSAFVQYYGMTETNGVVSALEPCDHDLTRPDLLKSCGKPYPAVNLKVMDAIGNVLPAETVGEVCIDTPALMSGYWRRPDATAISMHGRHYRTGDAGFLDMNGYLFLVDRVKDMIVSGGENIYPIEVERVLAEHPGVAESAVIGVPDALWGESVKAVVVCHDTALDEAVLIAFLRERIARYKVPKTIEFVAVLPRNAGGKLMKRVLRDEHIARTGQECG